MPIPSLDERLAADAKGARIIKALISFRRKSLSSTAKRSLLIAFSAFVCSDDPEAKSVVSSLADKLGFVAIDSGELARAQLVEAVADFIRFQILSMGPGPFATISVHVIPKASEERTKP